MGAKTKTQIETELRLLKQSRVHNSVILILNNIFKYGALVLVARYCYLSIDSLSGQQTSSNIVLQLITDLKVNEWFAYLIGGSGFLYGTVQSKLKKKTVERLQPRIQELEKKIDSKRSSSKLLTTGDTRPEDKI